MARQIELYQQIEEAEEKLGLIASEYCHNYKLVSYIPETAAIFRKHFSMLITAFRKQHKDLESFPESEDEIATGGHKGYLQTVSTLEVLGHLILNPYKLRIVARSCPDCDPYFIEVTDAIASSWAATVLHRIDLPRNDGELGFVYGRYDDNTKNFA